MVENVDFEAKHPVHCFAEMLETPYYIHYSPMRMTIHKLVTSKYFDLAISAVIGLNVITMAMEFYMMPDVSCIFCTDMYSALQKNWTFLRFSYKMPIDARVENYPNIIYDECTN